MWRWLTCFHGSSGSGAQAFPKRLPSGLIPVHDEEKNSVATINRIHLNSKRLQRPVALEFSPFPRKTRLVCTRERLVVSRTSVCIHSELNVSLPLYIRLAAGWSSLASNSLGWTRGDYIVRSAARPERWNKSVLEYSTDRPPHLLRLPPLVSRLKSVVVIFTRKLFFRSKWKLCQIYFSMGEVHPPKRITAKVM